MVARHRLELLLTVFSLLVGLLLASCGDYATTSQLIPVRIGWQTTWATQGQLTQVLKHTNVLELHGLKGEFVGVSYGASLNEAALAGNVDVVFTADQPAAALLARGASWKVICRLMFNRVALYVPPDSTIHRIEDLRGKTVAMPFGAAAQRVALRAIQDAGLDPGRDINAINLDITEQASVVQAGTRVSWGQIDAMAGFDPTVAILESAGTGRMLHIGSVVSVVLMSEEYIERHPDAPKRFLKAFIEAYYYYATHQSQANVWFRRDSQLTFDEVVLDLAASVEPNVQAKGIRDIDLDLQPKLVSRIQEAADFVFQQGLTVEHVWVAEHIDLSYLHQALAEMNLDDYESSRVRIRTP